MKKIFIPLIVLAMSVLFQIEALAKETDWKIVLITGTTSQSEEEFYAAELAAAADPGHIITDTYPDNFTEAQAAVIDEIVSYGEDPDVKAIVVCHAVPGTAAAFEKIHNELKREDILLIAGISQEDPQIIAEASDLVLSSNEELQGDTIMEKCAEWDVEVFVHYSFPRHLEIDGVAARKELLEKDCIILGIEYVEVTAPDPESSAGIAGAQQFITKDVSAKMEEYAGKKVAFFATNCAMQEPLQKAILDQSDAYYPQPCCPSPYHAFPATLGLDISAGGDNEAALSAIAEKLDEQDAAERYSTWPSPVNMDIIDAAVDYAENYIEGVITERNDSDTIRSMFEEKCPGAIVQNYINPDGSVIDNSYMVLLMPVDFEEYID